MAEVGWTAQALEDLEAICLFISRDAPPVAAMFAGRTFQATDRLADHPRLGRVVPELGMDHIREILLGSYRLIYRTREDQVQVLAVHHGARLLDISRLEPPS